MGKTSLESTNRLLKVIIGLLLRQRNNQEQEPSLRYQMVILTNLGLKPAEIAEILGRSDGYVRKELSLMRKSRKGAKNYGKQETENAANNG